jgi:hypothetical protein
VRQKGEISFIGILLVLMSLSLWSILIIKNIKSLNDLKVRTKKHLCFRYLYVTTSNYQKRIAHLNKAIKASFYLSYIPASKIHAQTALTLAKKTQKFLLVSYMKNMMSYKNCSLTSSYQFIKNSPYQKVNIITFKRNFNGTIKLDKKIWSFTYFLFGNIFEERISLRYRASTSTQVPSSNITHIMNRGSKLSKLRYGVPSFLAY